MEKTTTLKLIIEKGPRAGETLEYSSTSIIKIGRVATRNTFAIKDSGISSKHLCIQFDTQLSKWTLCDLDSSNGTALNGQMLKPYTPSALNDGDRIKIGELTSIVVNMQAESVVPPRRNTRRQGKCRTQSQIDDVGESGKLGLGFDGVKEGKEAVKKRNLRSSVKKDMDLMRPEENALVDQEVKRQSAAIRTIRDVETERLLTAIRLLESNTSKEQLQIPLLRFFDENLPNLTVSRTDKNGLIEVKWKDKDGDLYMNTADGGNMISYFLQHMSTTKSDFNFDFLSKAGKTSFVRADDLQMKDFVEPKPSGTHSLGIRDFMQTPGASSGRLSVGMTPKTLRIPKQGEMLMSVHGSPVGVYKENNMDAIHEIEEE